MADVNSLVIAARLDDVRLACDMVVDAAEAAALDERAVYHCQMAVDEALTNIIEHGYEYEADGNTIEIRCAIEDDRFVITITDDSPAFNPLGHTAPDPGEPLDTREPGGWGIYFIRKLMDDVHYTRVNNHNQLVLVKNRPLVEAAQSLPASGDVEEAFASRVLDNGAVVIWPSGRLDSNTSPVLEQVLNSHLQRGHYWLFVDLAGVEYIASSGLKILVSAWRRANEHNGDLVLSGLQPRIIEILEMVGFDMLFQIFPDLDDALQAQSKRA
ncbi:MAG TPA: anti-sigma factor antagonist [Aggregatilinea sp.]|jgi:serine/threonine-protein kinase RsbW|uniref:anti-sigma factor antagonist n=1 Tax=Aggregatilinea sp. TaxID=2806333 RepID=UPI002BC4374E|nr:anti-sigma factor antagonist [Aggregatilinea sp.]HML22234.1 anti-sigma factor antagonist [Aggregatilinea sp.]